ncbi:hypothetical protein VB773_02260 [Haloarculaceae archaeon H-GB2-1]|nr:hypothetical protein [Haloarculaceae archaeon H-GB1-1]MEA5388483.1 hypothetical protein [Haloarculaceae archaeon H-GB11]MEA5406518.1 hypothetical protein [Haloarculaceae archaeon H-GB2-1]
MSEEGLTADARDATDSDSHRTDADGGDRETRPVDLRTRIELLEEENERLREEYARTKQAQYRRTAIALAGLGVLAAVAALLFPASRTVLFALGGTGTFLGVLTYYLSPEQFLPASLGQTVYGALARNESDIVGELGLRDDRLYVPTDSGEVRLFVPQHADYELPDSATLQDVFLTTENDRARGLALEPTGNALVDEFERAVTGDLDGDAATLATQTSDALVEQFELVDHADVDADPAGGRVTVAVSESAYGPLDRFDHPVVSFLASALARDIEHSVIAEVTSDPDQQDTYRVTLTWSDDDQQSRSSSD